MRIEELVVKTDLVAISPGKMGHADKGNREGSSVFYATWMISMYTARQSKSKVTFPYLLQIIEADLHQTT